MKCNVFCCCFFARKIPTASATQDVWSVVATSLVPVACSVITVVSVNARTTPMARNVTHAWTDIMDCQMLHAKVRG